MSQPVLDTNKCTACSLCAEVCGLDVIIRDGNGFPTINSAAYCHACGHCIAICPQNALSTQSMARDEFAPVRASTISPLDMEAFLLTKRSCREFKDRPVEKSVIEALINVARMAPTSINCQERAFIVVTDAGKISELREALTQTYPVAAKGGEPRRQQTRSPIPPLRDAAAHAPPPGRF